MLATHLKDCSLAAFRHPVERHPTATPTEQGQAKFGDRGRLTESSSSSRQKALESACIWSLPPGSFARTAAGKRLWIGLGLAVREPLPRCLGPPAASRRTSAAYFSPRLKRPQRRSYTPMRASFTRPFAPPVDSNTDRIAK